MYNFLKNCISGLPNTNIHAFFLDTFSEKFVNVALYFCCYILCIFLVNIFGADIGFFVFASVVYMLYKKIVEELEND